MGALTDKVALVTGSSRGIGAAIAKLFAREGATVAVHGRDRVRMAAMRDEIGNAGSRAICVSADVTNFVEIEAMRVRIEEELGPSDVLGVNVGGSSGAPGAI